MVKRNSFRLIRPDKKFINFEGKLKRFRVFKSFFFPGKIVKMTDNCQVDHKSSGKCPLEILLWVTFYCNSLPRVDFYSIVRAQSEMCFNFSSNLFKLDRIIGSIVKSSLRKLFLQLIRFDWALKFVPNGPRFCFAINYLWFKFCRKYSSTNTGNETLASFSQFQLQNLTELSWTFPLAASFHLSFCKRKKQKTIYSIPTGIAFSRCVVFNIATFSTINNFPLPNNDTYWSYFT